MRHRFVHQDEPSGPAPRDAALPIVHVLQHGIPRHPAISTVMGHSAAARTADESIFVQICRSVALLPSLGHTTGWCVLERVIPAQHGVKNPIAIRLPSGQPIHFRHAIDGERMDCVCQFARPVDAKMAYRYVHYAVARQLERTLLAVQDCSRVVGFQPAGMTDFCTCEHNILVSVASWQTTQIQSLSAPL